MKNEKLIRWGRILEIIAGLLIAAAAYNLYLIPNEVAPGGFTGIGQLVNSLTGGRVPVGTVAIILNVPLFAVSMKSMGIQFGIRSLISSFALSFLIDFLPIPAMTNDPLLAAIFGGAMGGIGYGLILRGNATTGGTDMLGTLIHRLVPGIRVGAAVFGVDALVVVASGFVFSATNAMYALISAFLMNVVMDVVLEGPNLARAYYIISNQNEAIAKRVMDELERGVTSLAGRGMYSGDDRPVLFCVINRFEASRLRAIIYDLDPTAFVIATNVHEAMGEGFKPNRK